MKSLSGLSGEFETVGYRFYDSAALLGITYEEINVWLSDRALVGSTLAVAEGARVAFFLNAVVVAINPRPRFLGYWMMASKPQ